MAKYLLKKITTMLITLFLLSFLVFAAFSLIPGDPAVAKLGTQATPEKLAALREEMGLTGNLFTRYGKWLVSFLDGSMGRSYSYNMTVGELVFDKLPITVFLSLLSMVQVIVFSTLLGLYAVKHEGKWVDKTIVMTNQVVMAIPPFFAGIIITFVFGLTLKWFVPGAFVSYHKDFGAFLAYLIAPSVAIALPKIAMSAKMLRSTLLLQAGEDYVRTAYSRGNSTREVLYRHCLKNALIPMITFWGMTFSDLFAGSVVIEQVFGIPGLGRILLTSIANRDYPVVEAVILVLAFIVIVVNFLVDLMYRLIDPRMRQAE